MKETRVQSFNQDPYTALVHKPFSYAYSVSFSRSFKWLSVERFVKRVLGEMLKQVRYADFVKPHKVSYLQFEMPRINYSVLTVSWKRFSQGARV